jgi:predicted O-methyltransferase YrrM
MDLDINNIQSRKDFVNIINELGLKNGLEIGLGRGHNAIHLLENSSLERLFSIESWAIRNYRRTKKDTLERLKKYGSRLVLLEMSSSQAAKFLADECLDFIYIDGDHKYSGVKSDIELYYPKVRKGGFFGGHDYIKTRKCGVIKAVDEFFGKLEIDFNLTCEPNKDNENKSFWIIK